MTKIPKIAIYISGGILQAVRSNIGTNLEVELVDEDNDPETAQDRWEELQTELNFGNY
jgi:ABC-type branched-subunit amino acid transport system substrate-binding protein